MRENDVARLLRSRFEQQSNDIFIVDAATGASLSYGQFLRAVLRVREGLARKGLRKSDVLLSYMSNSIETAIVYFTALVMGLNIVPLDVERGEQDLRETISQVPYRAAICNAPPPSFITDGIQVGALTAGETRSEAAVGEAELFESLAYEQLYLTTFTSGSTGAPKGVMHSFRNLLRSSVAFSSRLGLGKSNVFCHNLPMSYMAGILNLIILPFASGGRVVVGRRFSVSNLAGFWNAPARYSVNTFCFIPTELALLLKLDRGSEGVEYARRTKIIGFVATAPLKPQLKQAFEERYGISLYESYGLSETLFVAANYPGRDRAGSVGLPLDGVSFEIGADGEVLIRTPWMFLGYSNAASPVQENCFPSGDLGEIEVDGGLRITGRKKDLIIRGGINISPRRIEELLDSSGAIEECAVVGVDDEILGEKVVCFFVPKGGDPDRVKRLSREVAAGLGKDYRIDKFVELRALPRNVNGKLDRQALRRSYTQ